MKPTYALWRPLLLIGLALFASEARGQTPKKASLTAKDLVDFRVEVLADDPFSPLNQVSTETREFRRGETVRLAIIGTLKPGAYTYPMTQGSPEQTPAYPNVLKITYAPVAGFQPLWPITETKPEWKFYEENGRATGAVLAFKHSPFVFQQDLLIKPDAVPGPHTLGLTIKGQVCNDKGCFPLVYPLETAIQVSNAPPVPVSAEVQSRLERIATAPPFQVEPYPPEVKPPVRPVNEKAQSQAREPMAEEAGQNERDLQATAPQIIDLNSADGSTDLLGFMLAGVFWGAISLITPCVFPMIPITVSFFLKQSEKQHHKPVAMATVYCATIIVVLTIAAVGLLSFFRWLSVNPVMNFALGGLFVFFALSLFGMYEIELPSGLARFTSQREGKGGYAGTMFMALTFTIVSFACVAPFLGGFGGTAAGSSLTLAHRILGGFAFAATFASPFFLLALFPNLLKKLPKSGSWLNSVKVVMGFLELAAALKFMRAGELVLSARPDFFTYDLVLGLWIAIALLCGLYLLNVYRLPHDSPLENIGVARMLFGLVFIGLGFYLLPAQFKVDATGKAQRPNGLIYAWVDSFLLPEPNHGSGELAWSGNLKKVIDEVREENKKTGPRNLVFVDFTGETCTNCKLNERDVFSKPEIRELFNRYRLVQLYTDKVPDEFYSSAARARFGGSTSRQIDDAQANLRFEKSAFNDERLPLYVILDPRPDGRIDVVAKYDEGKINNDAAFVQFLKKPLDGAALGTAQLNQR